MNRATDEAPVVEGWATLGTNLKHHYFAHQRSLCGRWLRRSPPGSGFESRWPDVSRLNCKSCQRKVAAYKARNAPKGV